MNIVNVVLHLPEELVKQAEAAGILTDESVAALLQSEIKRQFHITRFSQTLQQLRNVKPPLSEDEVDAEIQVYRAEKKSSIC